LILSNVILDRDLTIHTCHGTITTDQILDRIRIFYGGNPSRSVIWDMSDGNCSQISSDQVSALSVEVIKVAHSRAGGRTAIVAPVDLAYGLSRMYQVYAETRHHTSAIRVFRSFDEADH
jgi:hypothetical protein